MEWTEEQKKVIETRNSNILVSAAAGSGKTAVLVERIMSRITDPDDPVDVDELLIVTFTRAAAQEMRGRIAKRIADAREQNPDDEHLAEQTALIHNAKITTIDGFCADAVREYGHTIGLVPGARVAEEGEMSLLKADVLADLLEEEHGNEDPESLRNFRTFVETFATGKNERSVENAILKLYQSASSSTDPRASLRCSADSLKADSPQKMMETPWMRGLLHDAQMMAEEGLLFAKRNMELLYEPGGPSQYQASAEADFVIFEALSGADSYERAREILSGARQKPLSRKKNPDMNPALQEAFKSTRADLTAILKSLKESYFRFSMEEIFNSVSASSGPIDTLIRLTLRFSEKFAEAKGKKNLMDFSDLEHFALQILRDESGTRTRAAKEYAKRFREVMVDEYQDSNDLQEAILTAVSRIEDGGPNYFCVGDVKQSIYSFRDARPELFVRKYHEYREDPSKGIRIDLHRNFRSSRQVVDAVNGIFRQIMIPEVGGVDYDDDAALAAGAADLDKIGKKTELIAVMADEELPDGTQVLGGNRAASRDSRVLEARAVGLRIRELAGHEEIWDPDLQAMRKVAYRDIVILLRTMSGWADTFVEQLADMHIPAYSTAQSGYFEAVEVQVLLNYLSLLDNPQQDGPAVSVLASEFGGLTADELGRIRAADLAVSYSGSTRRDDISYYDAARAYESKGPDDELRAKLRRFFGQFDTFRDEARDTPLHELIYAILTETGYMDYCSALPGGAQRALNLRMLIDRAVDYEKTSYIGLFNFIRYIDNLRKQDEDFGELSTISEQEDVVRIYSIHKSKGLEYPIVFISGMSKKFNMQDMNAPVLIHPEMGAASDYIDLQRRERVPTMSRLAIRSRMIRDSVGEELRVLYVAMTRAKEKLIMTGMAADEEKLRNMDLALPLAEERLPENYIFNTRTYMEWVVPAAWRMNKRGGGEDSVIEIRVVKPSDVIGGEAESGVKRADVLARLASLRADETYDEEMKTIIRERFSFRYPRADEKSVPVELGVSEIKRQAIRGEEQALQDLGESVPAILDFEEGNTEEKRERLQSENALPNGRAMRDDEASQEENTSESGSILPGNGTLKQKPGTKELTGASRGTAYHTVMEHLDYERSGEIAEQIRELCGRGILTEDEAACVDAGDLETFVRSKTGIRAAEAYRAGTLVREQPFVLGVDAHEIRGDWPKGETVNVQGIIDAFWTERDAGGRTHIVLLDYKTDRVRSMNTLVRRYRIQLDLYARALEAATGLPVEEKIIWSFHLGRSVGVRDSF